MARMQRIDVLGSLYFSYFLDENNSPYPFLLDLKGTELYVKVHFFCHKTIQYLENTEKNIRAELEELAGLDLNEIVEMNLVIWISPC